MSDYIIAKRELISYFVLPGVSQLISKNTYFKNLLNTEPGTYQVSRSHFQLMVIIGQRNISKNTMKMQVAKYRMWEISRDK